MTYLIDKAGFTAQMHAAVMTYALSGSAHEALSRGLPVEGGVAAEELDGVRLMQLLAGLLVETVLLFDEPDEGLMASYDRLESLLQAQAAPVMTVSSLLPPAYMLDQITEQGRGLARRLFEDWLDCAHEFHELVLFFIHNVIVRMEDNGLHRTVTLGVLTECATRCLSYEIAAQELCDIVIEQKIGCEGWTLGESVSGLSAVAGRCLGLSSGVPQAPLSGQDAFQYLDQVAHVMTQEAIRLGIPAGTDWRFGLAANDCPVTAPFELIFSLWPECRAFFEIIQLTDIVDQAVACAKAAGRMLAVAAGGEMPELEPVVAKPLAMAALTDTYKTMHHERMAALV